MERRPCRLAVRTGRLAIIVLSLLLASATATMARGFELVSSDPSAGAVLGRLPSAVRLSFNEELAAGSRILVFDVAGKQVDLDNGGIDLTDPKHTSLATTLQPLAPGTYSVHWRAILSEGGETDGGFAFSVGARSAAADVLRVGMVLAVWMVAAVGLGLVLFGVALGNVRQRSTRS